MIIDTNNDVDRMRYYILRDLLDKKDEDLDKHYVTSARGSFTRRELAKEIESNTEIGKKHVEMLLHLAIDIFERKLRKTASISLESVKCTDGWYNLGTELGFDEKKINEVFEYGEYGSVTIVVDENLNIVGGKVHTSGK